ncbi:hypothetical protein D3C81_1513760 [compost metagenome]
MLRLISEYPFHGLVKHGRRDPFGVFGVGLLARWVAQAQARAQGNAKIQLDLHLVDDMALVSPLPDLRGHMFPEPFHAPLADRQGNEFSGRLFVCAGRQRPVRFG